MSVEFDGDKVNARQLTASSLAETTAKHIMDAIIEAKIKPSDSFPSQYELCKSFGVSRTVIREATQILVSKGVLDVQHGKRIRIRPPSHEKISESVSLAFRRSSVSVFDVLELRKVLEVEVSAFAALHAGERDLEKMKDCLLVMELYFNEEKGYIDSDIEFHRAIFIAAKRPAFDLVLRSLNDYLLESRKLSYRGEQSTKRALQAHRWIYEAILRHDADAAKEAMRRHLVETEEDLRESMKG